MEDMPTTNYSPHLINPTTTAATAATLGQNKDMSDKRVNKRERSKKIKNKNKNQKKKNNNNKNNININEVIIDHEEEEEEEDEDEDEYGTNNKEEEEEEKEEVERKIEALQRIVPGGESLGVDRLFEETAGYIMALQSQLKAMKALASFFEDLHKHKRMYGG
ncbi:hypothetical protein TIFTF001_024041 [Ficus carica]|uniref:Uncharacterized protein n=1 Tax=Ficus carica TaxID=3494 RepID=A0AA88ALI3_FICCA|nr:hypothetical protein TIFTF001_024041 [Ficus carica]